MPYYNKDLKRDPNFDSHPYGSFQFPKIRDTVFWVPYIKDPTIWGTIFGSPIFGNSHVVQCRVPIIGSIIMV